MSWTKKNVHPGKIVSTSQEVEVMVLEVDSDKRRISLGLKQAQRNPWEEFADKPPGRLDRSKAKSRTPPSSACSSACDGDVDGMVHMSDIAWGISGEDALALHRKGEQVKAVVLDVDVEKERISLGMKQLEKGAPAAGGAAAAAAGRPASRTTSSPSPCSKCATAGSKCRPATTARPASSSARDLGRDRDEQRPDRFQVGQKLDAMVIGFDRSKKPNFSIKARQLAEEKQAVEQYGSSDSGASLGDILGEALKAEGSELDLLRRMPDAG